MAGKGASVIVRGGPEDVEIGEVWESGHFAGSGVEGRVRRTPAGWSVLVDSEPVGTIGRDGAASEVPLRLEGGRVLHEDRVLARVDDDTYAAGALALVWLGRRAWYAPEAPAPAVAPAPEPEAAGIPRAWLATAGVLVMLALVGIAAFWA